MHEYRRFIQHQLDERGWDRADLVRKSGISRQLVHNILTDDREHLGQMPEASTMEALSKGLGISVELIRTAAARSLVGYTDDGTALTIQLRDVSTDALLNEVRRRIDDDLPKHPDAPGGNGAHPGHADATAAPRAPRQAPQDQEDGRVKTKRRHMPRLTELEPDPDAEPLA